MTNILNIDFGSGYNPKEGYKTCDNTFSPMLDYCYDEKNNKILGLEPHSVDNFHIRNVLHHIKDIPRLIDCLSYYLSPTGQITVIDCRQEYFEQNLILDILWYRYIIPRYEVKFNLKYIDYASIFKAKGYQVIFHKYEQEKEIYIFTKIGG